MRFIVIGLGNFGLSLSLELCQMGHEVIGIDQRENVVEENRDKITAAVCLNSTDELAMKSQPIAEVDAAIVAIGEDWASSIQTTALLKKLGAKYIIGRSLSSLHETVLQGLKVNAIYNPEQEAASTIAMRIISPKLKASYRLTDEVSIFDVEVPNDFQGKTADECELTKRYKLTLTCVIRRVVKKNLIGMEVSTLDPLYIFDSPEPYRFERGDRMIVCGTTKGFSDFSNAFL